MLYGPFLHDEVSLQESDSMLLCMRLHDLAIEAILSLDSCHFIFTPACCPPLICTSLLTTHGFRSLSRSSLPAHAPSLCTPAAPHVKYVLLALLATVSGLARIFQAFVAASAW
jgi:hypothetical protein